MANPIYIYLFYWARLREDFRSHVLSSSHDVSLHCPQRGVIGASPQSKYEYLWPMPVFLSCTSTSTATALFQSPELELARIG
jgi:hypothetical protein